MIRITYSHDGKEQIFESARTQVVIGRTKQGLPADLDLSLDPSVSHRHARVWIEAGEIFIEDLGSSYGIQVNDEEIKGKGKRHLHANDRVRLGNTTLTRVSLHTTETEQPKVLSREEIESQQLQIRTDGVFDKLDPQQLMELEALGVYLEYEDELVAADGVELGFFFYVVKGTFEVAKVDPQSNKRRLLAVIGPGECFGEMGFLTGAPAAANVMAVGKAICWAIQHAALREFIQSHSGGNRLTLNIALLLARRVQEGNTRLLGASASLSAYFGTQARASAQKAVSAPHSSDHAEMEIPDEVFDSFVCEVLNLPKNQPLTDAQRDQVRGQIEANQLDIIPWLEQGGDGKPLKVRLKFVQESPVPRVAVQAPRAASPALAQPRVVRVPQTRAQIAPTMPVVVRPHSLRWKIGNVVSWAGLPILTAFVVVLLLPLDSREGIAQSAGFKRLPFQGFWQWFIFRTDSQTREVNLQQGIWFTLETETSRPVLMTGELEVLGTSSSSFDIEVRVKKKDSLEATVFQKTVEVGTSSRSVPLFSVRLAPGAYVIECACGKEIPGGGLPAKIVVSARH